MIALPSTTAASTPASPIGDAITLVVWTVLAAFALRLVWRLPRGARGAWLVVACYCSVVAIDKAVDLQIAFYHLVQFLVHALDAPLGLRGRGGLVRVVLLVPITAIAVGCTIWLVRQDSGLDRSRKVAIAGLVLVLLLVGLRLLPRFGVLDEVVGWVVEGVACLLIACGLWTGWPKVRE